ncbi:hypothetical protein SKAU_G00387640 [Synaphobranchus kaupii]|uniref:Uncharacterized protein n=1 Tax=Synaphobranchus kaupii TaxID=118154 RepID=A0A9Q1EAZ4_SYNKA|nr:hypothetical protein SKAU_G00387640 [Synaphobranchus kaupii]
MPMRKDGQWIGWEWDFLPDSLCRGTISLQPSQPGREQRLPLEDIMQEALNGMELGYHARYLGFSCGPDAP